MWGHFCTENVWLIVCLFVFFPHQNQFLCLVVLQGRLKVFYDFNGDLVELEPKDPSSEYLRISDADPKTVGLTLAI